MIRGKDKGEVSSVYELLGSREMPAETRPLSAPSHSAASHATVPVEPGAFEIVPSGSPADPSTSPALTSSQSTQVLAGNQPTPAVSDSVAAPKRIFIATSLAFVLAIVVVVALVVEIPQVTAADSARNEPRASRLAPGVIVDPRIDHADPSIVWDQVAHLYRMYATNDWSVGTVPEYVSEEVTGPWTYAGNVLPTLPSWSTGVYTWAPEVAEINGVWTLWGSTGDGEYGSNHFVVCIYRATAPSPAGPFVVDPVRAPCDALIGGDIDPSPFEVGDQWWLVDKTNGNSVGRSTTFYTQRIGRNGELVGPRYAILASDLSWEEGMIEAPNFVQSPNRRWWLILSGGYFGPTDPTYRIAAVPCAGPKGGCDESGLTFLVDANRQGDAPGEQDAFVDQNGQWWLAYNPSGPAAPSRPLALVKLNFDARGIPYVSTP